MRAGNGVETPQRNLITDVPETASWLEDFAQDEPLVLGFYVYADGALHVQPARRATATS